MTGGGWLGVLTGLPGSGKTTLATRLCEERGAVRLTPDDWMTALGVDLWDEAFRDRLEQQLLTFVSPGLRLGWAVVVDYGSWARAERDQLLHVGRAAGATVELFVLDPPLDELRRRLEQRNRQPGNAVIDAATLDTYRAQWQRPDNDECVAWDRVHILR